MDIEKHIRNRAACVGTSRLGFQLCPDAGKVSMRDISLQDSAHSKGGFPEGVTIRLNSGE